MKKGIISLSMDQDIIRILDESPNKSVLVNDILREHLTSREQLDKDIEEAIKKLEKLKELFGEQE